MKNKTVAKVSVSDCGTFSKFTLDENFDWHVEVSGGCPVEDILSGSAATAPDAEDMARQILEDWMAGYEGDAHAAGLTVTVEMDGKTEVARA